MADARIKWTPERYAQLQKLVKTSTRARAAAVLGCSIPALKQACNCLRAQTGQPVLFRRADYRWWTKKERALLRQCISTHSLRAIAEKLGRSYFSVKEEAHQLGFKMRSQSLTFHKLAVELGVKKSTVRITSRRLAQTPLIVGGFARLTAQEANQIRQVIGFARKYSPYRSRFARSEPSRSPQETQELLQPTQSPDWGVLMTRPTKVEPSPQKRSPETRLREIRKIVNGVDVAIEAIHVKDDMRPKLSKSIVLEEQLTVLREALAHIGMILGPAVDPLKNQRGTKE